VPILVAIEAGYPAARFLRAAILRLVELLLRKRRHEEAQSLKLLGIENAVEKLVIIVDRHQLALGDIPQIGPRGEVDGGGKLGQKMIGDIEIQIEAGEVAPLLFLNFVDFELWKDHAAFWMIGMRQRVEAFWKEALVPDVGRAHRSQLGPGRAAGQLYPNALLQRLAPRHRRTLRRAVGEVV